MVDELVTAYHEAGHAVLAERLGGCVISVTIVPVDDAGPRRHGETTVAWANRSQRALAVAQSRVALAGPAAESIYCDEQYEVEVIQEWWADWLAAGRAIQVLHGRLSPDQIRQRLSHELRELITWMSNDTVWHSIATLADELAAHETLDSDHLDELRAHGVF